MRLKLTPHRSICAAPSLANQSGRICQNHTPDRLQAPTTDVYDTVPHPSPKPHIPSPTDAISLYQISPHNPTRPCLGSTTTDNAASEASHKRRTASAASPATPNLSHPHQRAAKPGLTDVGWQILPTTHLRPAPNPL
uniref:Uncharacterized protein n=1 Tax=Mycena chlorophos TaxID=658473 RepID=A0ABQ0LFG6_MYCCL|nr:predicted protein [Mycena chlorophos]